MKIKWICLICLSLSSFLKAAIVDEKVIICGIVKNAEKAIPNTIQSIEDLGACFSDYRVVIYEDSSTDKTATLLKGWANKNQKVHFISEMLDREKVGQELEMKKVTHIGMIARARNIVLDFVLREDLFGDYKYVVIADLDFYRPWDITHIVETIVHPKCEWDAVFGDGFYDHLAFRSSEFPIGFELVGHCWSSHLDELRQKLQELHYYGKRGPWRKVYSAFGGIGIYKRDAIKGCRYSEVVTQDLETCMIKWLEEAEIKGDVFLLDCYHKLLQESFILDLYADHISDEERCYYPEVMGMRLFNKYGLGKVVWFSCKQKYTLPLTCEHIPFHASMIVRGHDKLYINPKISSNPAPL